MDRPGKILIFLAGLLAVSQAGLLAYGRALAGRPDLPPPAGKHQAYFAQKAFYEEAYQGVSPAVETDHVYGGIVPHHLLVKDQLASFFEGLSGRDYETVILIGPNHFLKGGKVLASTRAWQTPYGELKADRELIARLGVAVDEAPFASEHSISGLVGFIKKSLPQAKLAPVILRPEVKAEEVRELARKISGATDPAKTLVLASVDFSHYQPVAVADFHDRASRAVIESFDLGRIYGLELDSPASVLAVLGYLEEVGAKQAELVAATNSGRLSPTTAEYTTSHNFYYFRKGEARGEKSFSGLFLGDLMLDRHVGERLKKIGIDGLLGSLAGAEGRFFMGSDVVAANLEGAVTDQGAHYPPSGGNDFAFAPATVNKLKGYGFNFFNLANNHLTDQGRKGVVETEKNLTAAGFGFSGCGDREVGECSGTVKTFGDTKVALLGFSMVYGDFDLKQAAAKVALARRQADLVLVNVHWGSEYTHQFSKKQQAVGRALIEAGADAIIGHHPHVIQGIEIYRGKPIFYSLGNFVFDQYFSKDTQEGLAVGLSWRPGELRASLFPLRQQRSVPALLKGAEREQLLSKVSDWSVGESAKRQAAKGEFEL